MEQIVKKSIFLASLTYGALITGYLDLQSNFQIVTFLVIYFIFVLIIWYRYKKRLHKVKFVKSKVLTILFPTIIVIILGFKLYKVYYNTQMPDIEGKWKVVELIVDDKKIESKSPICNKLIFWKHGFMFLKEKGIYNLRYHFGMSNKLIIDGGSIRTNHTKNYCVEETILRKMDIVNSYNYKLNFDTLCLENNKNKLVLIREE